MIQVSPSELGFAIWLCCIGVWWLKWDTIAAYGLREPHQHATRSFGMPHVRIPLKAFRSIFMVVVNTLKGSISAITTVVTSPMNVGKFLRRFKVAWCLTKQGTDIERFVFAKKGAEMFTDKELSDIVKTGLNIAKQSHPYTENKNGGIQLQQRNDNTLAYIKGGKWTNHKGDVLVKLKSSGDFNQNRNLQQQNKSHDGGKKQQHQSKKGNQQPKKGKQDHDDPRNRDTTQDMFKQ